LANQSIALTGSAIPLCLWRHCLGCAVFPWLTAADYRLSCRPHPLFALHLPIEFYPAKPTRPSQRPSPLMGFCSLQHIRNPRSTVRGPSQPAKFRLQGLIALLTVSSLEIRAGFVSHRQRSWDSPFGGFLSREVSEAFQPGRTHLPLARRLFRRRSVRPARRASVSGFSPSEIALRSCGVLVRGPPAPPLGFPPSGFANEDLGRTSPALLSRT